MGIFDEFKRLAHPYEDEDEDDFEDDFDVSPRPVDRRDRDRSDRMDRTARTDTLYGSPSDESDRRSNKVVNIRAATQLQVVLVKPEKFEDASAMVCGSLPKICAASGGSSGWICKSSALFALIKYPFALTISVYEK